MPKSNENTDQITITQFTDPMHTWCWGSEPIIRHLRVAYENQIQIQYVMAGFIEDFDEYYCSSNLISDPSDIIPHWQETSELHGMPVDTAILNEDPAESTYPASVAYVAARQQNRNLAHQYMRRLREAYFTQTCNINNHEKQLSITASVGLDIEHFTMALQDGSAKAEFEEDISRTRQAGIQSLPAYRIEGPQDERWCRGFQDFHELVAELLSIEHSLEPSSPPPVRQFVADYGPVATQEVAEVYQVTREQARRTLQNLAENHSLRQEARGNGLFWHQPD